MNHGSKPEARRLPVSIHHLATTDLLYCWLGYLCALVVSGLVVLLVVHWTTDHFHLSSNLSMGISEGCFIFCLPCA